MEKLIVANWKMNPSAKKEAVELFESVKMGIENAKAEVVMCPPFIYLPLLKGMHLGAQNVFYKESGAFTGEVSPLMLKNLGVEYVIVGHSEARKYLHETDEIIHEKIKKCLAVKLVPILCVGEAEGEDKSAILENQITRAFEGVLKEDFKNIVIAYEPLWAIGTGKNCSVEETVDAIVMIRKVISKLYDNTSAENVRVLYGGSVKSDNSKSYLENSKINGLLVGGASLHAQEFIKIVKSAE